jgi:cell division protease FtsH
LNDLAKNVLLWTVIAIVIFAAVSNFSGKATAPDEVAYSTFLEQVESGGVAQVTFKGNMISGVRSNGQPFITYNPETENTMLIGTLQ